MEKNKLRKVSRKYQIIDSCYNGYLVSNLEKNTWLFILLRYFFKVKKEKAFHSLFFLLGLTIVISVLCKKKVREVVGPITVLATMDMVMRKRRQKIIRYIRKKLIKWSSQSKLDLIPDWVRSVAPSRGLECQRCNHWGKYFIKRRGIEEV